MNSQPHTQNEMLRTPNLLRWIMPTCISVCEMFWPHAIPSAGANRLPLLLNSTHFFHSVIYAFFFSRIISLHIICCCCCWCHVKWGCSLVFVLHCCLRAPENNRGEHTKKSNKLFHNANIDELWMIWRCILADIIDVKWAITDKMCIS